MENSWGRYLVIGSSPIKCWKKNLKKRTEVSFPILYKKNERKKENNSKWLR